VVVVFCAGVEKPLLFFIVMDAFVSSYKWQKKKKKKLKRIKSRSIPFNRRECTEERNAFMHRGERRYFVTPLSFGGISVSIRLRVEFNSAHTKVFGRMERKRRKNYYFLSGGFHHRPEIVWLYHGFHGNG
jgi:hypothetical protein